MGANPGAAATDRTPALGVDQEAMRDICPVFDPAATVVVAAVLTRVARAGNWLRLAASV